MLSPLALAILLGLGLALTVFGQVIARSGESSVEQRLSQFSAVPRSLDELEMQQPLTERVLRPAIRRLAALVARLRVKRGAAGGRTPDQGFEAIRQKLTVAGNPYGWTPIDYMGTKIFAALALGGVMFFLLSISGHIGPAILLGGICTGLGWFGPDLLLRSKTQARRKEIERALPDAIDMLVISVEAGLGFDAAIQRLVDKRPGALSMEFARVLAEMRVGRSRRDAFRDLSRRTHVPDLNTFVGAILQAEQLGVSVTRVLQVQAEQARVMRRQRAEEKAAQLQLKMIFPLAIFIFPALCVVILGPVWPTIAATNAPGI